MRNSELRSNGRDTSSARSLTLRSSSISMKNLLATCQRSWIAFAACSLSPSSIPASADLSSPRSAGIKPLYWTAVPGGVGFSSEVRGLLQARMAAGRPNLSAIGSYLTWGSVRGPDTVLEDVREVEPGTYAEWCDGSIDERRWWHPAIQPHAGLGDAALAQQALHEALTDSVRRHLVADRPVGLFLSSGIDSGSLATVAASLGQIKTLTVSFNGQDEADPARRVARQLGTSHTQAHIEPDDVLSSLPEIIGAMDQPTVDGVNTWTVSRAAHQAGLVVALSGVGGDELFGGYPSFSMVPRARSVARLTARVPPRLRDAVAAQVAARSAGARSTRLLGASPDVGQVYGAIRGLFAPIEIPAAIPHGDPPRAPDTADIGDAVTLLELTNYMSHQLLRDTDQMSMAHSLEVRVPLLDDELLKLALRIPAQVRLHRGNALLARAAGLEMLLKKKPFSLPFDSWLRAELLPDLRESLLSEELPLADVLPVQFRQFVLDSFNARRTHWSRPWALLVLRRWADANELSW